MDIRRNESCSAVLCIALLGAITIAAERASCADIRTSIEVLAATYTLAPVIAPAETKTAINRLEKALARCEDDNVAFRIKYRIGVIHFKSHMMDASKSKFLRVGNDTRCPELVRVCSLNMVGQISRLQGQTREALEAFERVANILEQRLFSGSKSAADSASTKLWCSALFSKAEIYEIEQNHTASIAEYNRLLQTLSKNKDKNIFRRYAPLVNDRISQLYIRQGDIGQYIKVAEALIKDYPEYRRTPIVKLEMECVKFLGNTSANRKFVSGSFTAPAQSIALLKRSKGGTLAQHIRVKLESLCEKHQNTYEGILLHYHYAWFLDALGEKGKAADVLARILSSDTVPTNIKTQKKAVIETIQAYAKIQYAIIASERADYKEALRGLGSLQTHKNNSHVSDLAKSVIKSIEILKREVPRDENEEK